jgi:hypothetical protein
MADFFEVGRLSTLSYLGNFTPDYWLQRLDTLYEGEDNGFIIGKC